MTASSSTTSVPSSTTTTFVNLTPHDVNYYVGGEVIATFPPTGKVARVSSTSVEVAVINGMRIKKSVYGEVQDLPEQTPGVCLIVSGLLRTHMAHRGDLISPADPVRDEKGGVIGCRSFDSNEGFTP
jgi:hypothetical protein